MSQAAMKYLKKAPSKEQKARSPLGYFGEDYGNKPGESTAMEVRGIRSRFGSTEIMGEYRYTNHPKSAGRIIDQASLQKFGHGVHPYGGSVKILVLGPESNLYANKEIVQDIWIETKKHIVFGADAQSRLEKLRVEYNKLESAYKSLQDENQRLTKLAFKTFEQINEEGLFEIYKATDHTDALLILMELRENDKLDYDQIKDRIGKSNRSYLYLASLVNINFIGENNGYFYLQDAGRKFLNDRGL